MVVQVISYHVQACGLSDIGLVRENNEDAWGEIPELRFYVLADGMGGHQAGEIAARESIKVLCTLLQSSLDPKFDLKKSQHILAEAIRQVNHIIYKMSCSSDELRGMGTTLCCLLFHEKGVIYAHVGDSRIYCFRGKRLTQLTKDHSLLREMIDLGQITESYPAEFLYKNILTRAIGTDGNVEPSIDVSEAIDGDIFLMCTDGLSDLLTPRDMELLLSENTNITETTQRLVDEAKARGGHDNITVILAQVHKPS